jgi:hypothetical protein
MSEREKGWGALVNVRSAHYFKNGRSLCGGWMTFGTPIWEQDQTLGEAPSKGTCKACWKKAARLQQEKPHE